MPMANAGAAGVLQGQGMGGMQGLSGGGGGGGDGIGGVMPLDHLYGAPAGYGMPTPYGNMGQMFFPGQPSQ